MIDHVCIILALDLLNVLDASLQTEAPSELKRVLNVGFPLKDVSCLLH